MRYRVKHGDPVAIAINKMCNLQQYSNWNLVGVGDVFCTGFSFCLRINIFTYVHCDRFEEVWSERAPPFHSVTLAAFLGNHYPSSSSAFVTFPARQFQDYLFSLIYFDNFIFLLIFSGTGASLTVIPYCRCSPPGNNGFLFLLKASCFVYLSLFVAKLRYQNS